MTVKAFLKLVEIQTKVASMLPFFLGILYALYHRGLFQGINSLVMLGSLLSLDMGVTALNNFMDYLRARKKEGYNYEKHNAMVSYQLSQGEARLTVILLFTVAGLLGLLLVWLTSPLVLLIGGLSFLAGIAYSYGPLPLSQTPTGELVSGFLMGFVIFYLSYTINVTPHSDTALTLSGASGLLELQLQIDLWETLRLFLVSLPLFMGISGIMLANNICDSEDDEINGRRTLPLVIGLKPSLKIFGFLYIISLGDVILLLILGWLPWTGALTLAAFLPVAFLVRGFLRHQEKSTTFVLSVKAFVTMALSLAAALGLALILSLFTGCSTPTPLNQTSNRFLLDTVCTITLPQGSPESASAAAFNRVADIEKIMTAHSEESEIKGISRQPGQWIPVSPETYEVVDQALNYARESGGLFDPTIAPLVALWDIGGDSPRVPDAPALKKALNQVDYRRLLLQPGDGENPPRIKLEPPAAGLDLGAIAKGYAADEAARILQAEGIPRGIINFGGNVLVWGSKPGDEPWRIGIQDPLEPTGSYAGILETGPTAVVTSGIYERYFEEAGTRYHHILNPRTGYPADNNLLSVSLVTDQGIDADALSTTLFIMGLEQGLAYTESHPGMEALFITADKKIHLSSGLKNRFSPRGYDLAE